MNDHAQIILLMPFVPLSSLLEQELYIIVLLKIEKNGLLYYCQRHLKSESIWGCAICWFVLLTSQLAAPLVVILVAKCLQRNCLQSKQVAHPHTWHGVWHETKLCLCLRTGLFSWLSYTVTPWTMLPQTTWVWYYAVFYNIVQDCIKSQYSV